MIDEQRALQLARDAFRGSTDYFNANIRPQLERNIRQFQSKHNPDSKYLSDAYKARARFYRPKTRAMVRSSEAKMAEAFFSTADLATVTPQREKDELQQASAEIIQALLQYRLTNSVPWFVLACGAWQDAQVQGAVISRQEWEYDARRGKDQPKLTLLPLENVRFDPGAHWADPINTSPYVIELIPMYIKDIKARMVAGKWKRIPDDQMKTSIKQYDSTRLLREDNRTSSTDTVTAITDFTIAWVHLNIMVDDTTGGDVMYYTLGENLLLSSPEPVTNQFAHCRRGERPYVFGYTVVETHKNWPSGPVQLARDTQAEINEIANNRIDNVKFAMNKRYFAKRNVQVDLRSLTRNVPSSVTLMQDPEKDVKIVDTPDVTSSSYQEQDRLNMDFDEITGNMSQSSVQANRRLNETVGGMEILAGDANVTQTYGLLTFIHTWAQPVLRQIIHLEQYYETDEVILAIAADKAPKFQQLGLDGITDELLMANLTLTVNVGMSNSSPTQKINNILTAVNGIKTALSDGILQQNGLKVDDLIKEIFGAIGHKDGGRFFDFDQMTDPQVEQLMQQVADLQQQLQAKFPKELMDAQIEKLTAEKVTKLLEGIYAAMQAGEVLATVPQVAPIADKLMQAAGYTTPNPAGIDPNFPIAPAAQQAAATGPIALPQSGNTDPRFPANPGVGANQGIETQEADGVHGFANGGTVSPTTNFITGMDGIASQPGPDPRQSQVGGAGVGSRP